MLQRLIALPLAVMFILGNAAAAGSGGAASAVQPTDSAQETESEVEVDEEKGTASSASSADVSGFCFFAGKPPVENKYTVVRKVKLGKGTYGGVTDILPKFANQAKAIGADAIIDYTGSQRFGFWPWRMVRPVVRGVAVKWVDPKVDCKTIGGTTLQTMLINNEPPMQ